MCSKASISLVLVALVFGTLFSPAKSTAHRYYGWDGKACAKDKSGNYADKEGDWDSDADYKRYNYGSHEDCLDECSNDNHCKGYEYDQTNEYCDIYWKNYGYFTEVYYKHCFWKNHDYARYNGYDGYFCRVDDDGNSGTQGTDYETYSSLTFDQCMQQCTDDNDCKGFEYNSDWCETWWYYYGQDYREKDETGYAKCYWKANED